MHALSLLTCASLFPLGFAAAPTYSTTILSPDIAQKYARVGSSYRPGEYPHTTTSNGTGAWAWQPADWWSSGFFPGSFYLLNERSKLCPKNKNLNSVDWLTLGRHWSDSLVPLQSGNGQGHDQGFLSIPFLEELKVNPTNLSATIGVKKFANLLAARYSNIVGCTRSWGDNKSPTFVVIIDNMMNLELLFKAAELTGNRTLIDIAISHADKTIVNHIRPDGSSYHVVSYNETTGSFIRGYTAQGYADNSTWSRGQAWGTYGFAKMFNLTTQPQYLNTSRQMAKVFLSRLPANGIPPWDFDAPGPNQPADTSAATIAAEGLFILSAAESHIGNSTGADYYKKKAVKLMTDNFKFAFKPTWDSILSNGTSNNPQNNKNTGIVYGDYYALQAGNTMLKLGLASC
ncbi:glycoside hydrolase family 88 protein [Ceratobasidium sp. AG-Ba]|nr:glycoside hydrolase family 88 protein [Ceratobasidium sp. AG-Ba]